MLCGIDIGIYSSPSEIMIVLTETVTVEMVENGYVQDAQVDCVWAKGKENVTFSRHLSTCPNAVLC